MIQLEFVGIDSAAGDAFPVLVLVIDRTTPIEAAMMRSNRLTAPFKVIVALKSK